MIEERVTARLRRIRRDVKDLYGRHPEQPVSRIDRRFHLIEVVELHVGVPDRVVRPPEVPPGHERKALVVGEVLQVERLQRIVPLDLGEAREVVADRRLLPSGKRRALSHQRHPEVEDGVRLLELSLLRSMRVGEAPEIAFDVLPRDHLLHTGMNLFQRRISVCRDLPSAVEVVLREGGLPVPIRLDTDEDRRLLRLPEV